MYAAWFVEALRERVPEAECFGCAGPRMRDVGCAALLRSESIAMVGLAEVAAEIPRVWRQYRRLVTDALERRPELAVLVDAPSFNLRLARHFRRHGIPVLYLVAPQVWAWKAWRVGQLRRLVDRLLCIFPFEETWFRQRGVSVEYIGHPLTGRVRPQWSREEFFTRQRLDLRQPLLALLPGSRRREVSLNLPGAAGSGEALRRPEPDRRAAETAPARGATSRGARCHLRRAGPRGPSTGRQRHGNH